jgi:hypothetical protein
VPFHCNASETVRLILLSRHYSVNILYITTLVILYPFFVWYVCKLDSWAHILRAFDLSLKIGCDRVVSEVSTVGMLA